MQNSETGLAWHITFPRHATGRLRDISRQMNDIEHQKQHAWDGCTYSDK
jgi:hypothetical protein